MPLKSRRNPIQLGKQLIRLHLLQICVLIPGMVGLVLGRRVRSRLHLYSIFPIPKKEVEAAAHAGEGANGGAYGYFPMRSEALGYEAAAATAPDLREAFSMGPRTVSERLQRKYLSDKTVAAETADDRPSTSTAAETETETGATEEEVKHEFLCDVAKFCYQQTPWPTGRVVGRGRDGRDAGEPLQEAEGSSAVGEFGEAEAKEFQKALAQFYELSSDLGVKLLRIVAMALGSDEERFAKWAQDGEHSNSARAIWYCFLLRNTEAKP